MDCHVDNHFHSDVDFIFCVILLFNHWSYTKISFDQLMKSSLYFYIYYILNYLLHQQGWDVTIIRLKKSDCFYSLLMTVDLQNVLVVEVLSKNIKLDKQLLIHLCIVEIASLHLCSEKCQHDCQSYFIDHDFKQGREI